MPLQRGRSSYTCIHFHLVFSTKHRQPFIVEGLEERLYQYIGGLLGNRKSRLLAAGGIPDHVHLLVSLSKELSVSDALRDIKTNSSAWIHETYPDHRTFAWQTGYGAFAVSFGDIDRVKAYIAGQKEHHRRVTFKEEFVALLESHGIEYDERYLWE